MPVVVNGCAIFIDNPELVPALAPETPTGSTVQLKTVAALKVETLIKVDSPLHKSGCVALPKITGTGFTVTVIL